jgi:hypothetical protein
VATFDDEDDTGVEFNRFQCSIDPDHTWHHPAKNFYLRWIGWGEKWREKRDKYRETS